MLVVDDDRGMVESLCDVLELHGWETFRGYDGDVAADLCVEHDVDVVLMDVRMPKVNGIEALRRIKARSPRTRVILMTAYTAQDLLKQAEDEGALRILHKPFVVKELLAVLESGAREGSLLVIDDDPAYLDSLCDALGEAGLRTMKATTLEGAIERLESAEPGAVLLDLKLDSIDPQTSLLAIRAVSPSVLLVLYSGHRQELVRTMESENGRLVDAAFTKPISIDDLVELLDAAG